jgi:hypothetical protein
MTGQNTKKIRLAVNIKKTKTFFKYPKAKPPVKIVLLDIKDA